MTFEAQKTALTNFPVPKPTLEQVIIDRIREGATLEETKEYYRFLCEIRDDKAKLAFDADFVQLKFPEIPKLGRIGLGGNKGGYAYARWEDINDKIEPVLQEHGFKLRFDIEEETETYVTIAAILVHRDGHSIKTRKKLPLDKSGSKNIVQAYGSTQSYAQRYAAIALLNLTSRNEDDDAFSTQRDNPHTVRPEDVEDIPPPDHPDRIPPGDPDIKPLPKKNAREDFAKMQQELHAIRGEVELKNWGHASANRIATFPLDWQEIMRGIYAAHLASLRAKSPTLKAFEESAWLVDLQNAYENCEDMAEFFKVDQDMYEPWWPSVTEEARNEASKIRQARLNEIENPE